MDNRLQNLRMFFPAEVTGAFLAFLSLLKANNVGSGEQMSFVIWIMGALAIINVAYYWKFYEVRSYALHAILAVGFVIWALNIDIDRFKDLWDGQPKVEIVAPLLLIFYTLLTSFIDAPKRIENAEAPKPGKE